MSNTRTNALVQTWVVVTDDRGQTHLEAHWVDAAHVHVTHAA